ncbi:MAG: hypothetical protein QI223_00245 [Candidatus Korarchaeota archaeon]|nr:hypothetical protein [Candidatus Korarchaeota archaeon]
MRQVRRPKGNEPRSEGSSKQLSTLRLSVGLKTSQTIIIAREAADRVSVRKALETTLRSR